MYHIFFICLAVGVSAGCFHIMAITNSAVIDVDMQVSLWYAHIETFRYTLRSGTTGCIMFTQRNCRDTLHSLYSHQQCKYSFPYSLLSVVLTVALMTGAPWVLCVTLICISLQDKVVEQFKKTFIVHFNFLGLDYSTLCQLIQRMVLCCLFFGVVYRFQITIPCQI